MIRTNVIRDAINEFPDLFIMTNICADGLDTQVESLVEWLMIFGGHICFCNPYYYTKRMPMSPHKYVLF